MYQLKWLLYCFGLCKAPTRALDYPPTTPPEGMSAKDYGDMMDMLNRQM